MKRFLATAALLSTLAANAVHADTEIGPYVGLGAGVAAEHFDSIGIAQRSGSDRNGAGGQINLGYRITPGWGVEVGYANFGSVTEDYAAGRYKAHADSVYLAGISRLPLGDRWALYAKLVASSNRIRPAASNPSVAQFSQLSTPHKSAISLGLGAEYRFTPEVSGGIEMMGFGKFSDKVSAGLLSANLRYHF